MSSVHFKLVFPPPCSFIDIEERLRAIGKCLDLFKNVLRRHHFSVNDSKILHVTGNEETVPQITEIEVEVTAKYAVSVGNIQVYEYLCKTWMGISETFSNSPRMYVESPLLMIFNRKAFNHSGILSHQDVPIKDVQLGIFSKPCEFMSFASLQNVTRSVTVASFFHDKANKVEVPFQYNRENWLLTFSYKNIRKILVSNNGNSYTDLYLDLLHPPMFYIKEAKRSRYIGQYEITRRRLEVANIDRFIIGRTNVISIAFKKNEEFFEIVSRLRYRCQGLPVYYCYMTQSRNTRILRPIFAEPTFHFTNFACQYLLTAIFQRNFSFAEQCHRIDQLISLQVNRLENSVEPKHIEKALSDILFEVDSGKFVYFPQALILLSKFYSMHLEKINFKHYAVPEKSKLIRRVTITPTRLLLWPPEIMFENRILRNYDSEFSLRISFREDDMQKLSFNTLYCEEAVFDYAIRKPMRESIQIGQRTFEFLGWSNSQIRDHGVWCYARDTSNNTAHDIRQWMGDFSHIKSVPKYMARLGQAFSQTEDAVSVPLDSSHVRFENDIEGGFEPTSLKPYCFSDGIGKISTQLANKVHKALGHDMHCSAFQIRYGGCKGMLVIDPTLQNADIVFRRSMKKFESPNNTHLEIAKTSAPTPLQLNRPFIMLLDQLGVPPRIFLQLQERHLRQLVDILLDEDEAVKYLTSKTPLNTLNYEELSKSGIQLTMEPFFRSLLLSLHLYHLDKIKTHANIALEPDEGRNMLGVLDETGILQYGQVFVQYTEDILSGETTSNTIIRTGEVLVTKNPCMHPGDVRKFTAVDVPALRHIADCIVFPRNGHRPHPNEMSGSDLDGDEYAVIWKKELIFRKPNAKAAHYPSYSAAEKDTIRVNDMIDFLVEYIKNDQVGSIANAHLAQADNFGIFHDLPIAIASKFSIVVDYAKNGVKRQLEADEKPKKFPDFMEKHLKDTYKSKRALGKLYRVCKDFEETYVAENYELPEIKVDPLLAYPGWEIYKDEATKSRDKYNTLLTGILQTYGIRQESEAFSGSFTRIHCRFQERKDRNEIEKVVISSIKALCKDMKKEFVEDEENFNRNRITNAGDIVTGLLQKASAWYMVTYNEPNSTFLSFPWVVSSYLANVKIYNSRGPLLRPVKVPIITKIDKDIQDNDQFIRPLPVEAEREFHKWNNLPIIDRSAVKLALRVMMQWAWDAYIIQEEGYSNRGFLYRDTFARLFLYVVENKVNHLRNSSTSQWPSPASLCLAFFRFCVSLRFCNKFEVVHHVPFRVYKYKALATQAMTTFHDIAVTGTFKAYDVGNLDHGLIEMNSEYVNASCLGTSPISENHLRRIESHLVACSGVKEVHLREYRSNNKVIVTAVGSKENVAYLRKFLRKDCQNWAQL